MAAGHINALRRSPGRKIENYFDVSDSITVRARGTE
jgi:hypothetical protein